MELEKQVQKSTEKNSVRLLHIVDRTWVGILHVAHIASCVLLFSLLFVVFGFSFYIDRAVLLLILFFISVGIAWIVVSPSLKKIGNTSLSVFRIFMSVGYLFLSGAYYFYPRGVAGSLFQELSSALDPIVNIAAVWGLALVTVMIFIPLLLVVALKSVFKLRDPHLTLVSVAMFVAVLVVGDMVVGDFLMYAIDRMTRILLPHIPLSLVFLNMWYLIFVISHPVQTFFQERRRAYTKAQ